MSARPQRHYKLEDGSRYPSVTTILDAFARPGLTSWATQREREMVIQVAAQLAAQGSGFTPIGFRTLLEGQLPARSSADARLQHTSEIGNAVHTAIHRTLLLESGRPAPPPIQLQGEAAMAFMSFCAWRASVSLEIRFVESPVWSKEFGYAGTCDFFGYVNGVPTCIDWKTSNRIYPVQVLQVAAYTQALQEMGHAPADTEAMALSFPREGGEPHSRTLKPAELPEAIRTFACLQQVWRWGFADPEPEPLPTVAPQAIPTVEHANVFSFGR